MSKGCAELYAHLYVVRDSLQAVDEQLLVLRQSHKQQHGEGSGKQQQGLRHGSFICRTHTGVKDNVDKMVRKGKKV